MAYVWIQILFYTSLFASHVDGIVLDCTVYPIVLQRIPKQIGGTITIANTSNEEIYWNHLHFEIDVQFPLKFSVVVEKNDFVRARYIIKLRFYKLPRETYDVPLWLAEKKVLFNEDMERNSINFIAHSDYEPISPCLIGIILNTDEQVNSIINNELLVKIGTKLSVKFTIHARFFPIVFMITDIPISRIKTSVEILISTPESILTYQAKEKAMLSDGEKCTTLSFKVAEERSMDLTVIMSAHIFTSISFGSLRVVYRIYKDDDDHDVLFEKTELIKDLEFPLTTTKTAVPIIKATNYTIEAVIYGSLKNVFTDTILFQGVTYERFVPGIIHTIRISMLYIGPRIGTTIIGTVRQKPPNQNTWLLTGTDLSYIIAGETFNLIELNQFTIFNPIFPIQFTLLDVEKIDRDHKNIVFTISIAHSSGFVLWAATVIHNKISVQQLNRLDINLTIATGYNCQVPGKGSCTSSSTNISTTCCSQYKCAFNECQLP